MDSGWAVVFGAAIALIGSAVIPWVRDSITEAQRRQLARRDETRAALLATVVALAGAIKVGPTLEEKNAAFIAEVNALAALDLLLNHDEAEVAQIALACSSMIRDHNPKAPLAMAALSEVFAGWQRGVISNDDVFSSWLSLGELTENDLEKYR